jgi:hypothetical protein
LLIDVRIAPAGTWSLSWECPICRLLGDLGEPVELRTVRTLAEEPSARPFDGETPGSRLRFDAFAR